MEKREFLVRLDAAAKKVPLLVGPDEDPTMERLALAALQSAKDERLLAGEVAPQEAECHPVVLAVVGLYHLSFYPAGDYLVNLAREECRAAAWEFYQQKSAQKPAA